jgi:hypothetical protein
VITAVTSHKWANILVNNDFDEFTNDERGEKIGDAFWNCYSDLEIEAKQFVTEEWTKKEKSFSSEILARFIDHRFYELNKLKKVLAI